MTFIDLNFHYNYDIINKKVLGSNTMKKFLLSLITVLFIGSFWGCRNGSISESQIIEETTEQSINKLNITPEQSQGLNTNLELKTATLSLTDEWNIVDLSNENGVGDFDYLPLSCKYVVNISNDFCVIIEEYTIHGDNSSSDDILLNEYVQRHESDTVIYEEIGNKNCALIYDDGKNGSASQISYLFVENGVHYRFDAAFNANVDDNTVNKTIADIISTFEQHIDNKNVLNEISVFIFDDMLNEFQGEWKESDNRYSRLIINGETVNFIHESTIGNKEYCDVFTFYFGFDENDNLVINNQHSQPRYTASIDENKTLTIMNIIDESDIRIYEKVSDNTEVPKEKIEPYIGMPKNEVGSSTWGYPKKTNKTTTVYGTREQWIYEDGYIYITDGIVTAIQET